MSDRIKADVVLTVTIKGAELNPEVYAPAQLTEPTEMVEYDVQSYMDDEISLDELILAYGDRVEVDVKSVKVL